MDKYWYKNAFIYQIYPKSFQDSNGDGIGDIPGIISRLDYLVDLGVDAVWLSPVYTSPMEDQGYDISDYKNINPIFGTMDDFDVMVSEMHKRGIKLIMDLVINHTSREHFWFKEALKGKDNPYRDYYVWRKKPNNWKNCFGGKSWEYEPNSGEYYLHLFDVCQPDLNMENPKVREEVKGIMKFWLDKGVDGFRCDVINLISKDQRYANDYSLTPLKGFRYFCNGPRIHEFLHEFNKDVLSKYNAVTVGETVLTNLDDITKFTDEKREELTMAFNFDHTAVDNFLGIPYLLRKFSLRRFKHRLDIYQYGLNKAGWNTIFYENHDQRRSVGRFGTKKGYESVGAKMLATTMYFLKGTPFIYQGQELGMENLEVNDISEFDDVAAKTAIKTMEMLHIPRSYIDKSVRLACRDNARSPMQWNDGKYAGFSGNKPWIKVNENKDRINAHSQMDDEDSVRNYYKKVIELRHKYKNLCVDGVYDDLLPRSNKLFAYERRLGDELLLVISNFTANSVKTDVLSNYEDYNAELILSNYDNDSEVLDAFEARVYHLKRK